MHQIDVTVRVHGAITVGADYEQRVPAAIPWAKIVAILASKVNDTTLEAVVAEALALPDAHETALKEQAKAAVERLVDTTTRTCAGKVTTALAIKRVEVTVAEQVRS